MKGEGAIVMATWPVVTAALVELIEDVNVAVMVAVHLGSEVVIPDGG